MTELEYLKQAMIEERDKAEEQLRKYLDRDEKRSFLYKIFVERISNEFRHALKVRDFHSDFIRIIDNALNKRGIIQKNT